MRSKTSGVQTLVATAVLCGAAGCSTPTPQIDSHLGEAVSLINAQQVLHPDAGTNRNPVSGIDGMAGKSAQDEYQKSFRVPTPQGNAFTIGVGTK